MVQYEVIILSDNNPLNHSMTKLNFKIPILASLLAITGLVILINLGLWQLDRADQKSQILSDMEQRQNAAPLTLQALDKIEDKGHYHLQISGVLLQDYTLYLDNRIVSGRPGFEVIHPVRLGDRVVLVNRGWIPMPLDRSVLPELPELPEQIEVTGIVYIPTNTIVLKEDVLNSDDDWPQLIQALDMVKLKTLYQELGLTIEPWILRQDPEDNELFIQEWRYVNMPPERHTSYAVTWFGLAIALVIIYIAALLSKKEKPVGK